MITFCEATKRSLIINPYNPHDTAITDNNTLVLTDTPLRCGVLADRYTCGMMPVLPTTAATAPSDVRLTVDSVTANANTEMNKIAGNRAGITCSRTICTTTVPTPAMTMALPEVTNGETLRPSHVPAE